MAAKTDSKAAGAPAAAAAGAGAAAAAKPLAKVAVIVGVNLGLSSAIARRFAKQGLHVVLMSRTKENLDAVQKQVVEAGGKASSVVVDASDFEALRAALTKVTAELGAPQTLIYNASAPYSRGSLLDFKAEQALDFLKAGTLSCLVAAQQVLPAMIAAGPSGGGSILITGATGSVKSGAASRLAFYKTSLRSLATSLSKEFTPKGVHVAHFVIDGIIDTPLTKSWMPNAPVEKFLNPDGIADTYWHVHSQKANCWSFETDLRTHVEEW